MYTTEIPSWLSAATAGLASGDIEAWLDVFADDGVHEFPFAEEGGLERLEGKDAMRAYMSELPKFVRFGSFHDVRVREVGDDTVVEADGHHWDAVTGAPYAMRYVSVITRREGKVTLLRDYMGRRRPRSEEN
ncbi:nuclear transport factor 2 family protein [Streptomyces sp. NPDC046881]|uniref:nuclear transport factor 2 family protein n=1 Tax=Streptomyces sp. NPDC046881 TaxID=3155374 RepID=UPI0033FFFEEE